MTKHEGPKTAETPGLSGQQVQTHFMLMGEVPWGWKYRHLDLASWNTRTKGEPHGMDYRTWVQAYEPPAAATERVQWYLATGRATASGRNVTKVRKETGRRPMVKLEGSGWMAVSPDGTVTVRKR